MLGFKMTHALTVVSRFSKHLLSGRVIVAEFAIHGSQESLLEDGVNFFAESRDQMSRINILLFTYFERGNVLRVVLRDTLYLLAAWQSSSTYESFARRLVRADVSRIDAWQNLSKAISQMLEN